MSNAWNRFARYFGIVFCIALSVYITFLRPAASAVVETKALAAFSMNAAEIEVSNAIRAGIDFRRARPHLYQLGRITKPWAIVIDRYSNDWILLGETDLNLPAI